MLRGKTAIVTGSTSGIGLGIATALAAESCDVQPTAPEARKKEAHGARAMCTANATTPRERCHPDGATATEGTSKSPTV